MDFLWYIPYNTSLTDYAKENRKLSTRQEWIFWNLVLKKKQFMWYRFRRQKVIGSYILDFYCPKLLLWIEIDGWYHNERQDYDDMRDAEINKRWIAVIRFTNEEIDKNLEWVIYNLEDIIKDREKDLWIISAFN
jgi:very-short-patch-repair endonuclease